LDKNPKTLTDSAKLADEYNAVRKAHMKTQKTQFQSHIPKTRQINVNAPVSAAVYNTYGSNTTEQPQTNTHETSTATSRNTDKYSSHMTPKSAGLGLHHHDFHHYLSLSMWPS